MQPRPSRDPCLASPRRPAAAAAPKQPRVHSNIPTHSPTSTYMPLSVHFCCSSHLSTAHLRPSTPLHRPKILLILFLLFRSLYHLPTAYLYSNTSLLCPFRALFQSYSILLLSSPLLLPSAALYASVLPLEVLFTDIFFS